MTPISSEIIATTWTHINQQSEEQLSKLVVRMSDEQPLLMVYLMAVGEEVLDEDEQEQLLYYGVGVWLMMVEGGRAMSEVTETTLDQVEERNLQMLEYLESEPESSFVQAIEGMMADHNQKAIIGFLVEELMEATNQEEVTEEGFGLMLVYLKVVVECLDLD